MTLKPLPTLVAFIGIVTFCPAADLDFYRDVYPFLKTNCISCHNKTTTKGGLDMETPEMIRKGGETGPGVVPGKGAESLVVKASRHTADLEMPPKSNKTGAVNLSSAEIGVLTAWIDQGAKNSVQEAREVVWQPLPPGTDPIYTVSMTKDGRLAACGRANRIYLYDLATRQFVGEVTDAVAKSGGAHRALVQALAFSPDGTRLASGSFREVKIWRLETGKAAAPNSPVVPVAVDEALLKKITETGKVSVLNHAMSADGNKAATGCADGSVRVWDAATAKPITELRGNVAAAKKRSDLEWTAARQTMEQAFQKTEVTRIETQNKALDELLKKANEAIVTMKKVLPEKQKAVKPATDAKAAAQRAVDDAAALIAKAPEGRPDAALTKQLKDAQDKLLSAANTETSALSAVSAAESNVKDAEADVKRITDSKAANAKLLAAANAAIAAATKSQDTATAELAAAKLALSKPTTKPLAVAFSGDGARVAARLDDGAVSVWSIATGLPLELTGGSASAKASDLEAPFTFPTEGTTRWVLERTLGGEKNRALFADRVNAVRFRPDGKTLAAGGGEPSRSGDIMLFDVATGKALKTWKERHSDAVLSLDFSPDGKLLASGGSDKIARVTEIASGKQVNLFEGHTHHVMGVSFRADGRVLATAGADNMVLVWDMIMGERKGKIEGWAKEVTSLQFIGATNRIVTSAGDNLVRVVNDDGTEVRSIAKLPDFMQSAASGPAGDVIIGGGEDSVLRVWDAAGKELAAFSGK
jgi:WD40 repeat protein